MTEGIYAGYFTGLAGNSIAIFHFQAGRIVGADIGGGTYDGTYLIAQSESEIDGEVKMSLPPNTSSIAGFQAGEEPVEVSISLKLPMDPRPTDVFTIETPLGSVNARFVKLREL